MRGSHMHRQRDHARGHEPLRLPVDQLAPPVPGHDDHQRQPAGDRLSPWGGARCRPDDGEPPPLPARQPYPPAPEPVRRRRAVPALPGDPLPVPYQDVRWRRHGRREHQVPWPRLGPGHGRLLYRPWNLPVRAHVENTLGLGPRPAGAPLASLSARSRLGLPGASASLGQSAARAALAWHPMWPGWSFSSPGYLCNRALFRHRASAHRALFCHRYPGDEKLHGGATGVAENYGCAAASFGWPSTSAESGEMDTPICKTYVDGCTYSKKATRKYKYDKVR